jgi:hypothetical protein
LAAPLESHAETSVPLPALEISDDFSTHSNHGSYLRYESNSEYDEHVDDKNTDVEPPKMPRLAQTTL